MAPRGVDGKMKVAYATGSTSDIRPNADGHVICMPRSRPCDHCSMFVTPLPGVDVSRLLDALREAQRGLESLRAMDVGPHLIGLLEAYVRWVHNAVRRLRP